MARWIVAALLLAVGASLPAWAAGPLDCSSRIFTDNNTIISGMDLTRAVAACRQRADRGDAIAQLNLGMLYYTGAGVPQDPSEAMTWFRKAAQQGLPLAQYVLANRLFMGQGVPRDVGEAMTWHKKAADQGFAMAQVQVGSMYQTGMPPDYVRAFMWYSLAAAQGEPAGRLRRDNLITKMTPTQIEQGKALAAAWKPMTRQ